MKSGERGSPFGGMPGLLNMVVNVSPTKISSIASSLADCSMVAIAESTVQDGESQMSEMSSSVGPMPVGLSGDSE
jgi:hypothetical protein